MKIRTWVVCAALLLSACASTQPGQTGLSPSLQLAKDGLRAGDTGLEVGFGRAFDSTVAAVSQLAAESPQSITSIPCRGGTARAAAYPSGLTLFFDDWAFRGWVATGSALRRFPPHSENR